MIGELVEGERFTTAEPTPRLVACIEAAAAALREAAPGALVKRSPTLRLGERSSLVPSLTVRGGGEDAEPDLVVEFRVESTSRYVLGPKRLAYSRYSVPELWFVDPRRARIAVLSVGDSDEYGWPPRERLPGEVLEPERIAGVRVAVDALLAGWPRERRHEPRAGEEWWES